MPDRPPSRWMAHPLRMLLQRVNRVRWYSADFGSITFAQVGIDSDRFLSPPVVSAVVELPPTVDERPCSRLHRACWRAWVLINRDDLSRCFIHSRGGVLVLGRAALEEHVQQVRVVVQAADFVLASLGVVRPSFRVLTAGSQHIQLVRRTLNRLLGPRTGLARCPAPFVSDEQPTATIGATRIPMIAFLTV